MHIFHLPSKRMTCQDWCRMANVVLSDNQILVKNHLLYVHYYATTQCASLVPVSIKLELFQYPSECFSIIFPWYWPQNTSNTIHIGLIPVQFGAQPENIEAQHNIQILILSVTEWTKTSSHLVGSSDLPTFSLDKWKSFIRISTTDSCGGKGCQTLSVFMHMQIFELNRTKAKSI